MKESILAECLLQMIRGKHYYILDLKKEALKATRKGDVSLRDCLSIRIREAETGKESECQGYNIILKKHQIVYNPYKDDYELKKL